MSGFNPEEDVSIAERVLFIDSDGESHQAVVVDDCPGHPYITLVWGGEQGELGEEYHSKVETETSVYVHSALHESGTDTMCYLPIYWSYEGEYE